ncbi:MAG: DUF4191 domain-containing protein [Nitriliruptoraceae bacterium]
MRERVQQYVEAFRRVRAIDPKLVVWVLLGGTLGLLVGVGIGAISPFWTIASMVIFGLLFGLLGALLVFNRRATSAQLGAIEGQPGAAAAVLQTLRGQWFLTPAVAVNAKQDMVHRVVGRCGVVLVGEGAPQRVKGLLAKERKRMSRAVGDVTVTTIVVGDRDGEVPLRKLQVTLTKLPRELRKGEVPRLERKLKPLDRDLPIPKGVDPMAAASRRRPKPR